MSNDFNPPPNWPTPAPGWTPPPGWKPDPAWGPAPEGWDFGGPEPSKNKRKSWFGRHKILTTVGGLILVSGFINAVNGEDEAPADATAAVVESATPRAEETTSKPSPSATLTPSPSPVATVEPAAVAPAPAPTTEPATPPAPPAPTYGAYPPAQQAFLDAIVAGRTSVDQASTELQRSAVKTDRDANLCAVTGNGFIDNWVGKVTEIGANNDGLAHVTIEIADGVKMQTWNNAFSDLTDGTLIPPGTPAFDALLTMNEGALVYFSGQTVPSDTSCLKGSNLTDTFYMIDPNFVTKISDVRAQ